jgi:hypothetical protein
MPKSTTEWYTPQGKACRPREGDRRERSGERHTARDAGGDNNGGLVRFDRQTETYRRFESGDIGRGLALVAGRLVAATDNGITVIRGTVADHYIVDQTTDGRLRVVPAAR